MNEFKKQTKQLIEDLLNHLPDNNECWGWCWDELNDEAQKDIKRLRRKANLFLVCYDLKGESKK
uniref:Uncharacterized protein n=1 Tax=viral metagenome TaxID=1070528 RepID=A0A6M3KUX0_9ZZZZ